jgi:PTH1 family peptidyl-tRNA hydrolase
MKLIVGLGNPGRRYEHTRHNVGWWVLDHLADVWRFPPWRPEGDALVTDGQVEELAVRLIKPQTFMNLSGRALEPYLGEAGADPRADLLVVVDEVAIPTGRYRIRPQGSAGGHNGLRDLERAFGHQHYARLRVGVGPTVPETRIPDLADYVLAEVPGEDRVAIVALMPTYEAACRTWLTHGVSTAMNRFNGGPPAAPKPAPDADAAAPPPLPESP